MVDLGSAPQEEVPTDHQLKIWILPEDNEAAVYAFLSKESGLV